MESPYLVILELIYEARNCILLRWVEKSSFIRNTLSKIEFTEDELVFLYSLISLFLIDDKKLKRDYIGKIVDIFAILKTKNKKYYLLKKINNKEN